jgi:hypothetical protein
MLECRPYVAQHDYALLKSWWEQRSYPAQEPEFLPPTGLIISHEGADICAGFLFKTDAKIAVLGHVVSTSKSVDKILRSEALDHLIESLVGHAKECGFAVVTCSSNIPRLNERYEALGFSKSDENETHYGRVL